LLSSDISGRIRYRLQHEPMTGNASIPVIGSPARSCGRDASFTHCR
jgi:hypothetical protein